MRFEKTLAIALTMSSLPLFAADDPSLEVGSAAPALRLPSAGGNSRSLADADGPTVLVFFRGLW